jgi:hypothetical protein
MKNKYEIHPFIMLLASVLVAVFYFTYVYPMMKTVFERVCFTTPTLIFDALLFYTSLRDLIKTYFKNGGVMKKGKTSKSSKSKSEAKYSSPLLKKVKKQLEEEKLRHKGELNYKTKFMLSGLLFIIGIFIFKIFTPDRPVNSAFVFTPIIKIAVSYAIIVCVFMFYFMFKMSLGYDYPEKHKQ